MANNLIRRNVTTGQLEEIAIGTSGQVLTAASGAPYLAAPAAPVPTTATTGGTVAAGTYTVGVTYVNAQGETVASASGTVTTTGTTSTLTVPSPAASGAGTQAATGWYAYVSQAGGSTLTRQQTAGSPTAIGTALTLTAPPTSTGAAVPGANTAGSLVPGWAAAAGGSSLSSVSNVLSADVSMATANTYYDGPSVSLTAGTWLLTGSVSLYNGSYATDFTAKLWDGTTVVSSGQNSIRGAGVSTNVGVSGIATVASTTTYKISGAGNNASSLLKATTSYNAAGNTASYLYAVKIA